MDQRSARYYLTTLAESKSPRSCRKMMRKQIIILIVLGLCLNAFQTAVAREGKIGSPSFIVRQFYELLHDKRYAEGFRLSVYGAAIEGLSDDELRELAPDFERLASVLPAQIETVGEQINGDLATVFIRLPNSAKSQEISLTKIDGKWVIGDKETQKVIKSQGRNYFFNERMRVTESEINEYLQEILGAELIYFRAKQKYSTLEELIRLGGVSNQLSSGITSGYRFELILNEKDQSFSVIAVPTVYGRTGKLSFYSDQTNLIRAEDKGGKPATTASPAYQQRQD